MKRNLFIWPILVTIQIALFTLTACAPESRPLTGDAKDAVLAYADPMVDNLLKGFNDKDYATFSQNFTDKVKKGIPEATFVKTYDQVTSRVGFYVSRQEQSVIQAGDAETKNSYVTVVYVAKFEKDQAVTVTVSFDIAEPHLINGLWFNSEKLRQ